MKNIRLLTFVLTIGTLLLSACGAAAATATPAIAMPAAVSVGEKVEAMPVAFVGIVDSMVGDQWVISGTTMTVDASVVRDGPFNVGDRIKVEGLVNPDGSLTVSRVEAPTPSSSAADNSNEAISNANTNDASVGNTNDGNINDSNINDSSASNSNDSNTNDDNGGNANDDNSNDSNDNGDDNGGNDNGDSGKSGDDSGGDDNGSGGHGSDD